MAAVMTASVLPTGALMAIVIWSTTVIVVVTALALATRLANRRVRPRRSRKGPAHCLGLKPGVLPLELVAAYRRFVAAEFERDIAAVRELEHVPEDWLSP